jgi:hypothetical protein
MGGAVLAGLLFPSYLHAPIFLPSISTTEEMNEIGNKMRDMQSKALVENSLHHSPLHFFFTFFFHSFAILAPWRATFFSPNFKWRAKAQSTQRVIRNQVGSST